MTTSRASLPVVQRFRSLLVALVALAAVVGLWTLAPSGRVGDRTVASAPDIAGGGPRPERDIRLDLGTPTGRLALSLGFGPDEREDVRTFVRTTSERSLLSLKIAPDERPLRLTLDARAAQPGTLSEVRVLVNGTPVGTLTLGPDWSRTTLEVPGTQIVAGRNDLELVTPGQLLLDGLEVEPLSARMVLDANALPARDRRGPAGQALLELGAATSELSFELRPMRRRYVLGLRLFPGPAEPKARLRVFVNDVGVGVEAVPAEGNVLLLVPPGRFSIGPNRLSISLLEGSPRLVERVTLSPLGKEVFLDVGTPEGRLLLSSGFGSDDRFEHRTCAWSVGASSRVTLPLERASTAYRLTVSAQTLAGLAPLSVGVRVNGADAGKLSFGEPFTSPSVTTPAGSFRPGKNEIELTYARTVQPSAVISGSTDTRQIAVRYDWLALEPVAPP